MSVQTLLVGPKPQIDLGHVGGDLVVEGWDRDEIEIRGDDPQQIQHEDQSVNISSNGDLHLSLPRGANLRLVYVGGDLSIENVSGAVELSFVGGDAKLKDLTGEVSVTGVTGDLQMRNVNHASVEHLKNNTAAALSEHVHHKVQAAARRAQSQMEHRLKQAERTVRHAERAGHSFGTHPGTGRWKWAWTPGVGAVPAADPISDEERLAILKMLQEKKITADEAEKLLAALEGGS